MPEIQLPTKAGQDDIQNKVTNMKGTVEAIAGNFPLTGAVKSIQRGTALFSGTSSTTISINSVNVAKSVVFLNGSIMGSSEDMNHSPFLSSLTSNSLVIKTVGNGKSAFQQNLISWQIVEFN